MNTMKNIRIEKLTLNIGTGKPGPELEKAKKLLSMIAGRVAVETKTNKRIPGWGLRPGLSIGCKVTLRGEPAKELLGRLIKAQDALTIMATYRLGLLSTLTYQGLSITWK